MSGEGKNPDRMRNPRRGISPPSLPPRPRAGLAALASARLESRRRSADLLARRVALACRGRELRKHLRELRRRCDALRRSRATVATGEGLAELSARIKELRWQSWELREERQRQRQRQRQEDDLEQRHPALYRQLFDQLPDPVLVTDEFGTIHETNEAACALFDRRPQWLRGKPLVTLIDLADRRRLRMLIFEAIRNPGSRLHEIRLLAGKEAIPIQVRVASEPWSDEEEGYRLVWVLRDVRDLAATEERLDESERHLRTIFDSALEAVSLNLLEEGTYLDVNPEFERLSGFSREEILGRTPADLGLWSDPAEHHTVLAQLRERGMVRNFQARFRLRDGSELIALLSAATIRIGGRPAVVSFARDVTSERRAEAELRDLEQRLRDRSRMAELGSVVARVVHDLRNPLVAVSLNAGALVRAIGKGSPSSLAECAEDILAGARRLDRMLSSILAFTRRKRPELSDVDAAELARKVQALLAPLARERGVALSMHAAGPTPLRADDAQLLRVLENLVKNAIEAIGTGPGKVRIEVDGPASGQVRITVRDDGPGVPEGFDPFTLFASSKPEGTGLGLAIAREIAEAHGGTLTFTRLEPRGTAFHLDLPVDAAEHATLH